MSIAQRILQNLLRLPPPPKFSKCGNHIQVLRVQTDPPPSLKQFYVVSGPRVVQDFALQPFTMLSLYIV